MKQIIKKYIKSLLGISVLLIICNLLSALHPYILKLILEIDFSSNKIQNVIINFIIIYTLIHIILAICKNLRNIAVNKTIAKILRDIREELFNKVLKFKMNTFNKYNSSKLYTRLTADVDNLFKLFFGSLNILLNNVIHIIFMITMMFIANINLALIGFSTILVVTIVIFKSTKILKNLSRKALKKRDEENKQFSELYNKNKLTYLFSLQDRNIEDTNKLFNEELGYRRKYIFIHHFPYWILTIIQAIGIYLIIHYALNINTAISLGSIYLVLFYTKECKGPLEDIFNQLEELQNCLNSYNNIKEILDEKDNEDIEDGLKLDDLYGDIEFENVCMRYDSKLILKNLSFKIDKGSKITIAGRTGVGKTTITNVLMKLYDIEEGKILINGHDISKISIKSLREHISYISQTPYILNDTLRNNITLGTKNISDDEIEELINNIQVDDLFNKFKDGLDTKIKMSQLSYGELQVIAFIRAIVHKANIYIFDEPTSNMDLKTEKMIQNIIDKISKNSTVIIIAHRKSTIENSDKVIYLVEGKVDRILEKQKV